MQQMQDDQIIALYNARDERAIAETDRKYGDYCTSIAQNILHNMQDSEECVNDTWLITWNSIPPVCPPVLKHYLGKITRNLSLNRYKAKNRDKRGGGEVALALDELAEVAAPGDDVQSQMERQAFGEAFNRFLHGLPARECDIFIRRYYHLDSVESIAARYGLRTANVFKILSRTRKSQGVPGKGGLCGMTNEFILNMMSDVDPALISRAEAPVRTYKKPIFRVALIAAVIALILTACTAALGVSYTAQTVKRVEQIYPHYDGTVLHFVQIMLTEDPNPISGLLSEDTKQAIGSIITALRQSGDENEQTEVGTEDSEQDSRDPGQSDDSEHQTEPPTETEKPTDTEKVTSPAEDEAIFVHSSYDHLTMVAGEREIDVFMLDTYDQWRKKVEVTDPEVTHLKFRGWLSFVHSTPGTYGYRIDDGDIVYDKNFSKEPEDMVYTVSSYMGGKSCSRMEILIPVGDLAPGEHKVYICVKAANGCESNLVIFTVVIPDGTDQTGPDITDEPPAEGWSEGLEYIERTQNGETVYVVSGIGTCTDTELYIPPTYQGCPVVEISMNAFSLNKDITLVVLPSTIRKIGSNAFQECSSLQAVEFNQGLESIGDMAFRSTSLKQVVLPDSVTSLGWLVFASCRKLESAVLSKGLEAVGESMFSEDTALQSVTIPEGIEVVSRYAFYKCSMLETVVLPDSVTKIDYAAFELCGTQNGFHITLPKNLSVVNTSIFSQSGLVEIVIPESHTQIGEAMFMGCQDLRAVTLPAELQSIGRLAFSECDNLQKVEFYGTQEDWEAIEMPSNVRNQLTPLVEYVTE